MESCCHTEATTNNFPAIRAAQLMNRKKEAALEERSKQEAPPVWCYGRRGRRQGRRGSASYPGSGGSQAGEGGIKLNDGDNTRLTKYWMLTFSNFSYISTPKELLLLVTHRARVI